MTDIWPPPAARDMPTEKIEAELKRRESEWDQARQGDGHCGSPGEWLWERMDELAAELVRREQT